MNAAFLRSRLCVVSVLLAMIRNILHLSFWGSIALAVIYGVAPNLIGLAVSILLYLYLLKSVERISREVIGAKPA